MPSNTFLNLPVHKQKRLLDAAKIEFSKHLLEDASINQIIKNADIPRGSFYMYFNDKEDLYDYLLKEYHENMMSRIIALLKDTNGDFIKTWELLFSETIIHCLKSENVEFFQHVFLNLRFSTERKREHGKEKEIREIWKQDLLSYINKNLYHFKTEEELGDALELVAMLTNMSLVSVFMNQDKIEAEKQKFASRLRMLKYGLYKEEEK